MSKQTKITKAARGEVCQLRIPFICNRDPETTVACHLNGGGMASKQSDIHVAFGCSACHGFVDGGYANQGYGRAERDLFHLEGVIRTQRLLIDKGLIKIA